MTLAAIVHQPAPSTGVARLEVGARRPARGRRSAGPTVVVTLRLALDEWQDPAAALAELVDRIGGRQPPPSAPVWLAEVEHTALQSQPESSAWPASAAWQASSAWRPSAAASAVEPAAVQVWPHSRKVSLDGRTVALCRREFDLLLYLARYPGQVFTRRQLLSSVWGDTFTGERTVDVHVTRLRKKLSTDRPLITTVRGIGYRLADGSPLSIMDS